MTLPNTSALQYNGFTFPVTIKTKVTEEPVTSGDNRVVKWSKLTINVSGFLTQNDVNQLGVPGDTMDAYMLALRRKLQVHGKRLIYKDRGYGHDLDIGPGGTQRDVNVGPKAGKFAWWSLGGAPDGCHGAGFDWEISTCIAECGRFRFGATGVFSEVSFTVNYDVEETGLVTIAYHGMAQIPMSLNAAGNLDFNIDSQLPLLVNPTPVGFMRKTSRQLSPDRTSCTFTITDRQLETPYPNDVVAIDIKNKVKQDKPFSPVWNCLFTGTVRITPRADKRLAWVRFFNIVAQRLSFIRRSHTIFGDIALAQFLAQHPNLPPAKLAQAERLARAPCGLIEGTTEFEEDLFKNESRFSISFKIMNCDIFRIIGMSGLWRPVVNNRDDLPPGGTTWTPETAQRSLAGNGQRWGGLLQAQFANQDVIIDICAGPAPRGRVGG